MIRFLFILNALLASQAGLAAPQALSQSSDAHISQYEIDLTDAQQLLEGVTRDNKCGVAAESEQLVDTLRSQTHVRLCNTASWFDGLFGDKYLFDGEQFRGKVSLGFRQDEFDGFEPRLRIRIKTDLPNVSQRFSAFVGRVEEDSYTVIKTTTVLTSQWVPS